jgi:hypothetical protein
MNVVANIVTNDFNISFLSKFRPCKAHGLSTFAVLKKWRNTHPLR